MAKDASRLYYLPSVFVNPEWPTLMLGSGPPSVSF
jgi:hypothetical protein